LSAEYNAGTSRAHKIWDKNEPLLMEYLATGRQENPTCLAGITTVKKMKKHLMEWLRDRPERTAGLLRGADDEEEQENNSGIIRQLRDG